MHEIVLTIVVLNELFDQAIHIRVPFVTYDVSRHYARDQPINMSVGNISTIGTVGHVCLCSVNEIRQSTIVFPT